MPPPTTTTSPDLAIGSSALESFREKRLLVHLLFAEMAIENHCNVANEDAPQGRNANFAWRKPNKTIVSRFFELRQLGFEVIIETDRKFFFDFALGNYCVTKQPADYRAANQVIGREAIAAHGRDAALCDSLLIRRHLAHILRVGAADRADRADSHTV